MPRPVPPKPQTRVVGTDWAYALAVIPALYLIGLVVLLLRWG